MKFESTKTIPILVCALALALVWGWAASAGEPEGGDGWALNATAIESCSCPMFCTCYFSDKPAGHGDHGSEHYCKFNMAYKVNHGHYQGTELAGVKYWIAGDLGSEFGDGEADWAVVTFDPAVTEAQQKGVLAMLPKVFPIEWKSFAVGDDAPISWHADDAGAHGKLDDGKAGEVKLNHSVLSNTDDPVVVHNLKYWGVPRNDGFVLMPNEVNAYHLGDQSFETRGTNGFMVTIDINSEDAAAAEAASAQ